MEIRKCHVAEIAAAGAFYDDVVLWLDRHVNYPKWVYRVYPSEDSVREQAAAGNQYLCLENGSIAAAFVLNDDPDGAYGKGHWKKTLPDGSCLILHALAVRPDLQGQGLASEIIRFCAEQAKERGYRALRLDIVPENLPAARLYEKNGFTPAGTVDLERGIEGIPLFSLYELNW